MSNPIKHATRFTKNFSTKAKESTTRAFYFDARKRRHVSQMSNGSILVHDF